MTYIILPCYNEECVVESTTRILLDYISQAPYEFCLLFVDDGSTDSTWSRISELCHKHQQLKAVKLANNVGQQTATLAGIETCINDAEAVISMDADLQYDIRVLSRMVKDFHEGVDVVYGARKKRTHDTLWKRGTSYLFYKTMKAMGCNLVYNHSEFRLLSNRAARALLSYPERNLFVRCIVPQIGFTSKIEYYDGLPRMAGETKYTTAKLVKLAIDGITNFSVRPIRWIQRLGAICILIGIAVIVWVLVNYHLGNTIQGWPSVLISIWIACGLQILSIGIVGEYIGKIYTEAKRRPRYFVEEKIRC